MWYVKRDHAHNVSVPSFFYSVGSKLSKTVLSLSERDNCAIWFCCFLKIQLNFNCKEILKVAISFSLSVPEFTLWYQEQKRDTSNIYLQHTHYSCDQFLLCLVIHAFKSMKFRREIGSFGIVPIPACVRPGISFRALISCKIFTTVKISESFLR